MKNVFLQSDSEEIILRINQLKTNLKPVWGKMSVGQMLAHCNVTYEMVFETMHPKPNMVVKFFLKIFVKNSVVNDVSYPRNSRTGSQFLITGDKVFEVEKERLIKYIQKTQQSGANNFEGKDSNSFGPLNANEWNNMFYKHLDHHSGQFGV